MLSWSLLVGIPTPVCLTPDDLNSLLCKDLRTRTWVVSVSCAYEQGYEWSQPCGQSNHPGIFFSIIHQYCQQFVCATMPWYLMPLQSDKNVCCYLNLLEVTRYILMMQILADLLTLIRLQPRAQSLGSEKCLDCLFSHAGVGV